MFVFSKGSSIFRVQDVRDLHARTRNKKNKHSCHHQKFTPLRHHHRLQFLFTHQQPSARLNVGMTRSYSASPRKHQSATIRKSNLDYPTAARDAPAAEGGANGSVCAAEMAQSEPRAEINEEGG